MILNELYERSPEGYQDVAQDNSQPQLGDLRKLRRLNDVRTYEFEQKLKQVQRQYAPPAQPLV